MASSSLTIHGFTVNNYNKVYLHSDLQGEWDAGFKVKKGPHAEVLLACHLIQILNQEPKGHLHRRLGWNKQTSLKILHKKQKSSTWPDWGKQVTSFSDHCYNNLFQTLINIILLADCLPIISTLVVCHLGDSRLQSPCDLRHHLLQVILWT